MKFVNTFITALSLLAASVAAIPTPESEATAGEVSIPEVEQQQADLPATDAEQIEALFNDISFDADEEAYYEQFQNRESEDDHPTGPESCNFWLMTSIQLAGTDYQRWWGLYSHTCAKIGGFRWSLSAMSDEYTLRSALPYTIELSITGGGFRPSGYFWYSGRRTDLGKNMYCKSCSGIAASRCCRVAFRCYE
ncbi:unnamed protein product [Parascedosporium putredinis]|uniref:Uncharacterized protein n=1 Tax=Parascedosporium putredinis TaxID=1442378 RepID=A0A9P1M8R8_9PEZI|nr:unnamed protein product [Parascedosporium putredinis]CAI7994122.1 unnamed protein product [Parascedosporium putredinis]